MLGGRSGLDEECVPVVGIEGQGCHHCGCSLDAIELCLQGLPSSFIALFMAMESGKGYVA